MLGFLGKKIIERLHNVKASQRKRHLSDSSTPKAKRGRPKTQSLLLTRYPPLTNMAGDDIVMSRDFDALHKELEKSNPRKEKILSLCRQTFTNRREEILVDSEDVTATSLLQKFKELHKSYVVIVCYYFTSLCMRSEVTVVFLFVCLFVVKLLDNCRVIATKGI